MNGNDLNLTELGDDVLHDLAYLAANISEGGEREIDFSVLGENALQVLAQQGGVDGNAVGADLIRLLNDVDPNSIQPVIQQAHDYWLTARPMDDPGLVSNEVPGSGPSVIVPLTINSLGEQQVAGAYYDKHGIENRQWKGSAAWTTMTVCATSGSTLDELVFVHANGTTNTHKDIGSEHCRTSERNCVEARITCQPGATYSVKTPEGYTSLSLKKTGGATVIPLDLTF